MSVRRQADVTTAVSSSSLCDFVARLRGNEAEALRNGAHIARVIPIDNKK